MASKHLMPSDDEDQVLETSAGEEEEHNFDEYSSEEEDNSDESSSEEDEPTKGKKVITHEEGDWFYKSFMAQVIKSLGGDEDFVKKRWSQVTVEKKKMLEDKWRVLLHDEFEALAEKTKLVSEVVSAIVKAFTH